MCREVLMDASIYSGLEEGVFPDCCVYLDG